MGVWRIHVRPRSSNWKELRTILRALQHEKERPVNRVKGCTVFYFTDNLVSYYVVFSGCSDSPGLHALVLEIKALEQELECHLEVVHLPGTLMIQQGTDGLSRGIWISPRRQIVGINQMIFQPVPYTVALHCWALDLLGIPRQQGYHVRHDCQWAPVQWRHCLTFWTPPSGTGTASHHLLPILLGPTPVGHLSHLPHPSSAAGDLGSHKPPCD